MQTRKEVAKEALIKQVLDIKEEGEVFKEVPDTSGKLYISNRGRVKTLGDKRYGIIEVKKGEILYTVTGGKQKRYKVLNFILENFLSVSDPKHVHLEFRDGNPLNFDTNNLKVVSKEQYQREKDISLKEETFKNKEIAKKYSLNYDGKTFVKCLCINYKKHSFSHKDDPTKVLEAYDNFCEKFYIKGIKEVSQQMLENESFRRCKSIPNILVSNLGRVIQDSYPRFFIRKPWLNTQGYKTVNSYVENKLVVKRVHQLVAEAFLGHVIDGHTRVVDHLNFDIEDNRLENLRDVSNRFNSKRKKADKNR